jgi:thiol-disulfide isomerase/thioredoxin/outer membrane lipoprotein-sorting protein
MAGNARLLHGLRTRRARWKLTPVFILLVSSIGCQRGATDVPPAAIKAQPVSAKSKPTADAATLLRDLAAKYQKAKSYEDAGTLRVSAETPDGQKQQSPPMPFSVAFERPDKIRVHSMQASVVADGSKLFASSDSLENQVLVQPCPQTLTVSRVFGDELLVESARAQLGANMPQLALLLDASAVETLTRGSTLELLDDADYDGQSCRRVAVKGAGGTAVWWISPQSGLLVKYEFPSDELKKQFEVAQLNIAAEFKGARVDGEINQDAFVFNVPGGAKLVKRLMPPPPQAPSALLGEKPAEFAFVGLDGKPVSQESLEGKVVVLDLWATWCGWCFEGFPNLEKVYQQFKGNDKVVILAVNQDDATVTDEAVRKSFEKAKVSIPIVRDSQHVGEKILRVEGLPTMVVLGANGAVEDYHIGFDPKLAETLPPKIKKLLAGESPAQEELDKYRAARKKYDDEFADAVVSDGSDSPAEPSESGP